MMERSVTIFIFAWWSTVPFSITFALLYSPETPQIFPLPFPWQQHVCPEANFTIIVIIELPNAFFQICKKSYVPPESGVLTLAVHSRDSYWNLMYWLSTKVNCLHCICTMYFHIASSVPCASLRQKYRLCTSVFLPTLYLILHTLIVVVSKVAQYFWELIESDSLIHMGAAFTGSIPQRL